MEFVTYFMLAIAVVAVIDRIIGNKLGLGAEFENGIMMLGSLALSMGGMLIMAPLLAHLFGIISENVPLFFDFSIIPAAILANDMGAAHLALELCDDPEFGLFNGLIVASMIGATISFTIPFSLQITAKEHHNDIILGILCGIVTMPVGCIVAGIMLKLNFLRMIINLIPLLLFAAIIAVGLLKFEALTIKAFMVLGFLVKMLVSVGLLLGVIEFLTGKALLPYIDTLENAMSAVINIVCIMTGAFPLIYILKKLFAKPLTKIGQKLGINDTSAFGFLASMGTSLTTFNMMKKMDRKGIILNAAFSVSAAFVLVDHLAFTLSFNADYLFPMIVGKLISGVSSVVLAYFIYGRKNKTAATLPQQQ